MVVHHAFSPGTWEADPGYPENLFQKTKGWGRKKKKKKSKHLKGNHYIYLFYFLFYVYGCLLPVCCMYECPVPIDVIRFPGARDMNNYKVLCECKWP